MQRKIALGFLDKPSVIEQVKLAKYAELKGFDSVWVAETRLVRDAVSVLGAIASNTNRIRLGSSIINVWSRIAPLTALTWSTLYELAPGRVILGLGAWADPLAWQCGVKRRKVLTRVREYVRTVRSLLNMETLTLEGSTIQVRNLKLDLGDGADTSPKKIPILIGANRPQLLELAGEISDGVILDLFVAPSYNRMAIESISKGAAKSSRSLNDLTIPQMIVCSVDSDRDKALKRVKHLVTLYLIMRDTQDRWTAEANGIPSSLIEQLVRITTKNPGREGLRKAEEIVDDEVVALLSASGTIDDCIAKVKEYVSSGCTLPMLCIDSENRKLVIDAFSEEYV